MKRKNILQFVRQTMRRPMTPPALCILALLMAACTQDELTDGAGTALPEGKYPMTFSTAVEGLTVTRANTAEGQWTEGDPIAVQVEGSGVKQYTPATGSTPITLQAASNVEPFYWQKSDETKKVSAWYCGTECKETLPETWAVQSNQSTENGKGYQQSDFLYAPETTISFAERNSASLTFYHQTAKVIINIVNGEAATNVNQIQSVVIGNNNIALSGTYTKPNTGQTAGTWNTSSATMSTITPKSITPASGCLKSYAALVIPQNVTDEFIAVTLNNSNTYYYTPENSDGNLVSGQQHTYNITVKHGEYLEVQAGASVSWTDEDLQNSDTPTEATSFRVTLSGNDLPTLTLNGIENESDNVYKTTNSNSNSFSLSYTVPDGEDKKGFIVLKGIADVARTIANSGSVTYTFTYTNIHSDLCLEYNDFIPQVGDYYYADGSWSPTYTYGISPACIGIVFKVGAGTGDDANKYDNKLPDGIHGYVVALNDANANAGAWGIRGNDVAGLTNEESYVNKYDGYANTTVIRNLGDKYNNTNVGNPTANGQYWAFKVASEYNVTAPANTSGWYLPSIGQLSDIHDMQNRATLLQTAGGADFKTTENDGRYWSSTEKKNYDAWYYQFNGSGAAAYAKSNDGGNLLRPSYVRAILTF